MAIISLYREIIYTLHHLTSLSLHKIIFSIFNITKDSRKLLKRVREFIADTGVSKRFLLYYY